jgi:hypothetical protein
MKLKKSLEVVGPNHHRLPFSHSFTHSFPSTARRNTGPGLRTSDLDDNSAL